MRGIKLSSFLQWKLNIYFYLAFGWNVTRLLVFSLGKIYFFFNREEKKRIVDAIFEVISREKSNKNCHRIAKNVFKGILAHYYEKMFIAFEDPERATRFLHKSIQSRSLSVLNRKLAEGNGVIMVTGHYGAIEYIPTLLAVNGYPVSMIARFNSKQLKEKVFAQAVKYDIKLIDAEETGGVIASAVRELRENRIVITECDEINQWRPSKSEKISFLGKTTGLDRTINVIHKRTNAKVVFGVIHRYSLQDYELIMYSYEGILRLMENAALPSVGETVLKFLEQCIYANPEQWYQWKNYSKIGLAPSHAAAGKTVVSLPLLEPDLAEAA